LLLSCRKNVSLCCDIFFHEGLDLYNEEELCMDWVIVGCFAKRALMLWRGLLALLPFFQGRDIVMHPEMG
jgi:hypothetical protein